MSKDSKPEGESSVITNLSSLAGLLKKDLHLMDVVYFIIWMIVLLVSTSIAYRKSQVKLFEVPLDRYLSYPSHLDLVNLLDSLPPVYVIFLPLLLLVFRYIVTKKFKVSPRLKKFLDELLLGVGVAFGLVTYFLLRWSIGLFGDLKGYSAGELIAGLAFFGLAVLFIHLLELQESESQGGEIKEGVIIKNIKLGILSFVSICSSIFMISSAFYSDSYQKRFFESLCSNLSLVTISAHGNHKIGWMLSRDEFVLIREKNSDVYRTIELPKDEVSEIVYLERFGDNEERKRAFISCSGIL